MAHAAVIGSPVSHSRSPAIFSFIASQLGQRDFGYSTIEVRKGELPEFLNKLKADPAFVGVNATIPHKEELLGLLDDVAPEARAVGAVNVVHHKDGKLLGYNTDVLGVVEALLEQKCRVENEDTWIWGAGGAARATAYALGRMGARSVYIRNRDEARAAKLCDDLGALLPGTRFVVARDGMDMPQLVLLVNATPLGMKGSPSVGDAFSELPKLPTRKGALAFDLVYNPERTPFLATARQLGFKTLNGLDMLVYQALATWEIWMGKPLERANEIKVALVRHLRERPIFLTGFMGVGKSVVGQALANKLDWDFVDTDEWVVRKTGMPIAQIFESQGEAAFRALEGEAIAEAASKSRAVVSLGGGALMNPESFAQIEKSGVLVLLDATAAHLEQRLMSASAARPLLAGLSDSDRAAKIREMLDVRKPVYDRAQFKVSTNELRPNHVAEEIIELLFDERGLRSLGLGGGKA